MMLDLTGMLWNCLVVQALKKNSSKQIPLSSREGNNTSPFVQGEVPRVQEKGFHAFLCWKLWQGTHISLGSALPSNLWVILGEDALVALCVEAIPFSVQPLAFLVEKSAHLLNLIGQSSESGRPRFQILLQNIADHRGQGFRYHCKILLVNLYLMIVFV